MIEHLLVQSTVVYTYFIFITTIVAEYLVNVGFRLLMDGLFPSKSINKMDDLLSGKLT
jgi:type IV secretory pathway VirB6-like protein